MSYQPPASFPAQFHVVHFSWSPPAAVSASCSHPSSTCIQPSGATLKWAELHGRGLAARQGFTVTHPSLLPVGHRLLGVSLNQVCRKSHRKLWWAQTSRLPLSKPQVPLVTGSCLAQSSTGRYLYFKSCTRKWLGKENDDSTNFFFFWPHCVVCRILVSWPRIESQAWQWNLRGLTTWLPENSFRAPT